MADPVQQTQYQTNIPQELMPYAQDLLGKAEALTSQTPYQPYQGAQVAQFSPLQQQSYDYASQMKAAPQLQDATAMAGLAGLGGLNTQYTYKPSDFASTFAKDAQGNVTSPFMSPYMQGVVDVQQREAKRQADIAQQQRQAQAVNAGAFGGARQGIMNAQANAELQRNLQGIQATGLQNAYQQAMQQYNTQYGQNAQQQQFGAGLGMQGLGLANQAAANLGALGQTQYGQNVGLIGLQNQLGLQQQQQAQNVLNTQYQNYQNQLNYPYKNLGFMSDIIRGVPLAQSSATMYQAPPTTIQSLASLGLGAAGLSSLFKADGGLTKSYASGGSVLSPEFKQYAVDHIDPRLLPVAERNAQARGDLDTYKAAIQQMAEDAAFRRGIAPALPQGFDVVRAAGGGILGFAGGSKIPSEQELMQMALQDRPQQDADQYEADVTRGAQTLSRLYGEDPTVKYAQEMENMRKQYQGGLSDFDRGVILAQMAGAVIDPAAGGNTMRGLGLMAKVGGQAAAQAMAQNRQADRDLLRSQVELSSAQQNRKEGRINAAVAHKDRADALAANAFEQKRDSASKLAQIVSHEKTVAQQIAAQAGIHTPQVMQIANEIAKDERNKNLGREELLTKAAKIAYAGPMYGADVRGLGSYLQRKDEIEKRFAKFSALPKNNPTRIEQEAERDRQLEDLRRMYPNVDEAPSGGISSALPQGKSMRDKGFKNLGVE